MKSLPLSQVVEWCEGALAAGSDEAGITGVSTDTRTLEQGDLFVALRGEKFDGHRFLEAAVRAGAAGCVVESPETVPGDAGEFAVIVVDDTLKALQSLARSYRKSLNLRVVGITGSNGKTSTKEMVAAALGAGRRVQKTRGNLNNHIGVPLTLLELDEETEWAVVEMGMNHPGEIRPLAEMAAPDIGVITGIGWAHIEFFDSRDDIAEEKGQLFRALKPDGVAVFNGDDPYLKGVASWTRARQVRCGFAADCEFQISELMAEPSGIAFELKEQSREPRRVRVPLFGKPMARNAALALAVAAEAGIEMEAAIKALQQLDLPGGRLAVSPFREGWLIDDTYNASPDSVRAAMESLDLLPGQGRKGVLLGSMAELGARSRELHEWVGSEAVAAGVDYLIAVGKEAEATVRQAVDRGGSLECFVTAADHAEAVHQFDKLAHPGDRILVKGSRAMKMETIVQHLKEKD